MTHNTIIKRYIFKCHTSKVRHTYGSMSSPPLESYELYVRFTVQAANSVIRKEGAATHILLAFIPFDAA